MDVITAIRQRKSVRAFTEQAVETETIKQLLDIARCSPSGANTQPWQVLVVTGDAKQQLQTAIETAFRSGVDSNIGYHYYPDTWIEPYLGRRRDCGMQMYAALGIQRGDRERRREQWINNYRTFDAPVMLLFYINPAMEKGSYMDYGMFLQTVMLTAKGLGLATCPQAALAEYPDIVREILGVDNDQLLLCGMALGYEDTEAAVNHYRTPREAVDSFCQFFE